MIIIRIIELLTLLQISYCSFNEASRILSNHTLDSAGSISAHYQSDMISYSNNLFA